MKKFFNIIILVLIVFAFSCSTKKYIYFREDTTPLSDTTFYKSAETYYQLQPDDIIYLRFKSSLSEAEDEFNFANEVQSNPNTGKNMLGDMYLTEFVINSEGYIIVPVIGRILAAGNTISEIQELVQDEARKYLDDVIVKAKLVSYTITFVGEFGAAGKITFYKDRVNLLDAISQAGDVTYFGARNKLRIMRQTPEGIITYRIDLTDKNLLTSEKFYLQPNDVVYAEPTRRKIWRLNATDYTLVLAVITSTIAILSLTLNNK